MLDMATKFPHVAARGDCGNQTHAMAGASRLDDRRPHSVRGFLTAVVRKKLGLTLVSEETGEERVYRVIVSDIPLKRKSSAIDTRAVHPATRVPRH
jgi:hypothetical protein